MFLKLAVPCALVSALALVVVASAGASKPRMTDTPSIQQQGSQLLAGNGGWISESGPVEKFVFRFSRDGGATTLKGPNSVPATTEYPTLPTNTWPDAGDANIYNLTPADYGKEVCIEVWGGTHSQLDKSPTALPGEPGYTGYNVWEWGHESVFEQRARRCLVVSGTPLVAPSATAAPAITGIPMVGDVLTASRGTWAGSEPVALAHEWQRCDVDGANCAGLGVTSDTYTVLPVDVGKRLRIKATGTNGAGARSAESAPTPVVTELRPTADRTSIDATRVTAPHKLVIENVTISPKRVTRRGPVVLSLRVSDTRGFRISGALVSVAVAPKSALVAPVAATTTANGLVTFRLQPGQGLNLTKANMVTLVLNARRPTDRMVSPRAANLRVKVAVGPAVVRRH